MRPDASPPADPPRECDLVVVGAGIVGLATARELARRHPDARDAYRLSRIRPRDLAQTLSWPGTWRLIGREWRYGLTELRHGLSRRAFVAALRRFVPELS